MIVEVPQQLVHKLSLFTHYSLSNPLVTIFCFRKWVEHTIRPVQRKSQIIPIHREYDIHKKILKYVLHGTHALFPRRVISI